MNDVTTTVRPSPLPDSRPASAANEPTLITEQQVLFATAVVVGSPQTRPRRWTGVFRGVVRTRYDGARTPAERHHPRRYGFLEQALMARELDRL